AVERRFFWGERVRSVLWADPSEYLGVTDAGSNQLALTLPRRSGQLLSLSPPNPAQGEASGAHEGARAGVRMPREWILALRQVPRMASSPASCEAQSRVARQGGLSRCRAIKLSALL